MDNTSDIWLLKGASLFDGTSEKKKTGSWSIVIQDGTIEWVGPDEQAPPINQTLDAGGRTVIPGLINAHVHLTNDGGPDLAAQVKDDTIPIATLRAANSARAALEAGITTVKDCGAANHVAIELSRAIDNGLVSGARTLAAGRVLTMTGGHGHFMGVEVDGPDLVRKAVRSELKRGAHFIKAMATGGVLTQGVKSTHPSFLQEELKVIVEEAHNAEKRVSAHAIGREGIHNALLAGVDTIEHGYHFDDRLFELAISQGTYLVPTLSAIGSMVKQEAALSMATWMIEKAQLEYEHSRQTFKEAIGAGMKIAAGTDAGTPYNNHDGLIGELIEMVRLGFSPERALLSATRDGAENAGVLAKTGTLQPRKQADFVVVDGDPLTDIRELQNITTVVKDGRIVRNSLDDESFIG